MRTLHLIAALLFATSALAQESESYPYVADDVLHYSPTVTIKPGDMLKIGTGSMPDGDFKYIRISSTSLFQYSNTNSRGNYVGGANEANAFPRRNSGLSFKVVRVDRRGNRKNGFVYYPVITNGMVRYEVDIDNALRFGEVLSDGYVAPSKPRASPFSVADELKKLKELKDQGIISEEEFAEQKKKLLSSK